MCKHTDPPLLHLPAMVQRLLLLLLLLLQVQEVELQQDHWLPLLLLQEVEEPVALLLAGARLEPL